MKPELASAPDRICTSKEKAMNQGLWKYPAGQDLLELELQATVSHCTWVLVTQTHLGSPARAVRAQDL